MHDRHVDEEDRAPPEVLEQDAADDRPEPTLGAGDGGPHADGPAPLTRVGEDVGEDRSVAGMMSAPPMPMNARVKISTFAELGERGRAEPTPKITRPIVSAPLRPKRSPRLPAVSSRPANTSV